MGRAALPRALRRSLGLQSLRPLPTLRAAAAGNPGLDARPDPRRWLGRRRARSSREQRAGTAPGLAKLAGQDQRGPTGTVCECGWMGVVSVHRCVCAWHRVGVTARGRWDVWVHLSQCWCVHDCQPVRVDTVSACFPGVCLCISRYMCGCLCIWLWRLQPNPGQFQSLPWSKSWGLADGPGGGSRGEEAWAAGGGEECVCALSGKRWIEGENQERR